MAGACPARIGADRLCRRLWMLDRFFSAQFKRDYKRAVKQGLDVGLLLDVVELLAQEVPLESKQRTTRWAGITRGSGSVTLRRTGY